MDLAELDALGLVEVAGAAQYDEPVLVVLLDLRALAGLVRVLDGELVEVQLVREAVELLLRRVGHADPDEPLPGIPALRRVREADRLVVLTNTVDVVAAIDDHRKSGFPVAARSPA